ncbi:MAG: hypothetical protein NC132_06475 [Corallococcus sp.]|nr:hypothetical protein [Corallococcus sp.]MCM1395729.1 hypothetical protein [Corallococcus sp.]
MGKLINIIKDKFSVIPLEVFKDKRLDYRSRGILATLISLPDGWNFSIPGLVALVKGDGRGEGKDAVRASLQYLEKLGYLRRIQSHDENGAFLGYDYQINIPPIQEEI